MKHTKLTAKLLAGVCTAAMSLSLFSALPASAAETAAVRLMGDLNSDLEVSVEDAITALHIYVDGIAGIGDATANAENGSGDIDMDGEITVEDAMHILRYYCQTLVGDQPLWAEIRELSYVDGTDFYSYFRQDENGELLLDDKGQPILVKPNAGAPFERTGMYIELGCATGAPGEVVSVPVYIAGLPKLAGFQMLIGHDPALTLTDINSRLSEHPDWKDKKDEVITNPRFDENHGCVAMGQAYDMTLADGYVISEFLYQIPEDAQSGAHYAVTLESYYTKFITAQCDSYQYTALSGVVTVE